MRAKLSTFDFLGFTHICSKASTGKLKSCGEFVRKRRNAKLQAISEQLRYRREEPIAEQGAVATPSILDGYYRYHAYTATCVFLVRSALKSLSDGLAVCDGEVTSES